MSHALHIVSFDIPYPPHYGGVIDVFCKIQALHQLGVRIHLHCFRYRGKAAAPELRRYCEEVYYYPRPVSPVYQLGMRPFVVRTRQSPALLERLVATPCPILFEGLHTCGFIDHPALGDRRKLVRMHNVEWQYYRHLARLERHPLRRIYLGLESLRLRAFEPGVLRRADVVLPISVPDEQYFRRRSPAPVHLLPAFHGHERVASAVGSGAYALYHGNLSVRDNARAARFLVEVFRDLDFPLVIAGMAPPPDLQRLCAQHPGVRLVAGPTDTEMADLMRQAHLHLLYSFQSDGMKIKLLHALALGRHVVANPAMVRHTGLEDLCRIATTAGDIRRAVRELAGAPFREEDRERRQARLSEQFSDARGAKVVCSLLI